jgi:hypothetical protein
MTTTETKAQQLYQHLENQFDLFWKLNKDDSGNYLAGQLATKCREAAEEIKALVKEHKPS